MIRVGLTGGIGSGKSTVLQILTGLGAAAIDADAISRSVTAPGGAAIPAIVQRFGAAFIGPDGALDRERMREQVYADPLARRKLEAIIHPLVGQEIERQVEGARSLARPCAVFDIPLLVESGRWRPKLDRVLVVDCHPETQVRRVQARSGLAAETVGGIIAAQATRAQRLAAADLVIFNDRISLAELQAEVEQAAKSFGL
ncbi:MAG TPA: dephospho-CoA kinase [Ramlibacter sp.]|nr:dephospho-CoA kinase [Ramlibacter sp.]